MKVAILFSGGKDSVFSTYWAHHQSWDIKCLLTIKSKNQHSYMFHTPNIDRVKLQAEALDLPLIEQETEGKKEEELNDLKILIQKAKDEYNIYGVVVGAIASEYQRIRINQVCMDLNIKVLAPIWHRNEINYMNDLIKSNFDIKLISISAYPLNEKYLMKKINKEFLNELIKLNEKYGLNICGEGGEYESFVIDCPIYKKKIKIIDYQIEQDTENSAKIEINELKLINK